MRILKDDTIALLIDVQERLMPHIFEAEKLEKNLNILVEGLNLLHVPIIVSEQYKKGLGETIASLKELVVNCPHNEKTAFSCFDEPTIQERIELSGRRNIILFGVEAHVCLLQTAIDLKERGFNNFEFSFLCYVKSKPPKTTFKLLYPKSLIFFSAAAHAFSSAVLGFSPGRA